MLPVKHFPKQFWCEKVGDSGFKFQAIVITSRYPGHKGFRSPDK